MNEDFKTLTRIIHDRRAVFPQNYKSGQIDKELIISILENARWAPTHKKTEPWRFVVFQEDSLRELSDFLSAHYKKTTNEALYSEIKWKKAGEKPLQSAAVIAICIQRSPEEVIPPWEETAALACSVQNIWLSCTALGIGSYWNSPSVIKEMKVFLDLGPNEECLGLFYMGWMGEKAPAGDRKSIQEIARWR
ncbi:MAG: nitroreductase [Bacteroidota bacterium]|nr:nitroreductase [Bacteroidota bacterium]